MAASGTFELTAANQAAVVDLCRRLDGLPLAIELAAVRTRVLSVEQILDRLADRFSLLTGGSRAALPRHQTLRTTIEWSHDLLSGSERALLRRSCAFAGRFTLEDVESVCGYGEVPPGQALGELSSLVDQNLIRRVSRDGANPRYQMLHVVREFATERLIAEGEQHTVRRACAAYLGGLARRVGAARGAERENGHLQISEDINTIRAWLGHVSLATTNVYAEVDLEMKAKALANCEIKEEGPPKPYREDKGLMEFLRSL